MRMFVLRRSADVSGVSGTGVVAEGIEFHDKQCCLSWFGQHHCISVWPSIADIEFVHGHGGLTVVEWLPTAEKEE